MLLPEKQKLNKEKNISNFFTELLEDNPSLEIHTIEGDVLTITKAQTAHKARDDFKTVNDKQVPLTDQEFLVKLHVESHIDEIAETSKKINKNGDNKKHSFAKDGFTYRKAYFEDFDGQYYEITLSIGHNGTVATVYNVGKIKESVIPSAKIIAGVGSKPLGTTPSANSISQKTEIVNRNFSPSDFNKNDKKVQFGESLSESDRSSLLSPTSTDITSNDVLKRTKDIAPIAEDVAKNATTTATEGNSVTEKISTKLQNLQTELENNKRLRDESNADFDLEIKRLQAEYEAKKNKNTKVANDILRRIERIQRLKANVNADYDLRINSMGESRKFVIFDNELSYLIVVKSL